MIGSHTCLMKSNFGPELFRLKFEVVEMRETTPTWSRRGVHLIWSDSGIDRLPTGIFKLQEKHPWMGYSLNLFLDMNSRVIRFLPMSHVPHEVIGGTCFSQFVLKSLMVIAVAAAADT